MTFPWYIWIPRGLIILISLLAAMFSADVFEGKASIGFKLLALLMHNIPVFIVWLALFFTWKHPLLAGIVFGVLMLVAIVLLARMTNFKKFFWIDMGVFVLPVLISSLLFLLVHFRSIRN